MAATDMRSYQTRTSVAYTMHEERLDYLSRVEWAEWTLRYGGYFNDTQSEINIRFRIYSVNYSVVEGLEVEEASLAVAVAAHEIKAHEKPKISSIVSTSLWKTCTKARPPNLL
jgi:hypothetical protein